MKKRIWSIVIGLVYAQFVALKIVGVFNVPWLVVLLPVLLVVSISLLALLAQYMVKRKLNSIIKQRAIEKGTYKP